jgi:hypothetical protein
MFGPTLPTISHGITDIVDYLESIITYAIITYAIITYAIINPIV